MYSNYLIKQRQWDFHYQLQPSNPSISLKPMILSWQMLTSGNKPKNNNVFYIKIKKRRMIRK